MHSFIAAIDFKNNDLAFILTGHYCINLVIGGKADMSSIQLHYISNLFSIAINFRCHAIHNIFFLILVNHIAKITVRKKVSVDHTVIIRYIILVYFSYLNHIVIQHGYPVSVTNIFIDKKIAAYFASHFKIYATTIIFIWF